MIECIVIWACTQYSGDVANAGWRLPRLALKPRANLAAHITPRINALVSPKPAQRCSVYWDAHVSLKCLRPLYRTFSPCEAVAEAEAVACAHDEAAAQALLAPITTRRFKAQTQTPPCHDSVPSTLAIWKIPMRPFLFRVWMVPRRDGFP